MYALLQAKEDSGSDKCSPNKNGGDGYDRSAAAANGLPSLGVIAGEALLGSRALGALVVGGLEEREWGGVEEEKDGEE